MDNVRKLMELLKNYDINVWKHSIFVMKFSFEIMKKLDLHKKDVTNILIGSLLHDIGKLKICKEIINKPGKLDIDEWDEIKRHPTYGGSIINQYEINSEILPLILYHHERWDGKGYYGLAGKHIHFGARVIAIADSVEAMSSQRPYQNMKKTKEIFMELLNSRGSQFDPDLINQLFKIESNNQLIFSKNLVKEQGILEKLISVSRNFNSNIFYSEGY